MFESATFESERFEWIFFNERRISRKKKDSENYNEFMDYQPLIKRTLIESMHRHRDSHLGMQYKNALLLLPSHPILSLDDIEHMITSVKIAKEMIEMIRTGDDFIEKN